MKLIVLFILFTLSNAYSVSCEDYGKWLDTLDQNYNRHFSSRTCQSKDQSQNPIVKEHGCDTLASLELEISKLENELSLLNGIDELITQVRESNNYLKDKTHKSELKDDYHQQFKVFDSGIKMGAVLETMKNNKEFESLNSELLKDTSVSANEWNNKVKNFCKSQSELALCIGLKDAKIDQGIIDELREFFNLKTSENGLWKKSIEIQDEKNKPLSFQTLFTETLKLDYKPSEFESNIPKKYLNHFKSTPRIFAKNGSDFTDKLKNAQTEKEKASIVKRFDHLKEEISKRDGLMIKSRIIHLHAKLNDSGTLNEQINQNCSPYLSDKFNYEISLAANCLKSIETLDSNFPEPEKQILQRAKNSLNNLKYENQVAEDCRTWEKLKTKTPEELNLCSININPEMNRIQEKLEGLNNLKKSIHSEKFQTHDLRDAIVQKMSLQNCDIQMNNLLTGECSLFDKNLLNPDLVSLTTDTTKALLTYVNKEKAVDLVTACENAEDAFDKEICAKILKSLDEEADLEDNALAPVDPNQIGAPTAPKSQANKKAVLDHTQGLLYNMMGEYQRSRMSNMPYNPYPTYPGMNQFGQMGLANELLMPHYFQSGSQYFNLHPMIYWGGSSTYLSPPSFTQQYFPSYTP